MKDAEIPFSIEMWSTYSSNDGFDYLILSDDKLNVYKFEVFYLKIGPPLFKMDSYALSIEYDTANYSIIALLSSGKLMFFPTL